jgi:hypothetical protein
MTTMNMSELSDDEIMLLLMEGDPDSVLTDSNDFGNETLQSISDENLIDYLEQMSNQKTLMEERAIDMPSYLKNQAKLGLTDTLTFSDAIYQGLIDPVDHVLGHLFFGAGGSDLYLEKQQKMFSELVNFKNSDEYANLLQAGDNDEIEKRIRAIQLKGGSVGLNWGDMIDAINLPDIPFTKDATYWQTFTSRLMDSQEDISQFTGANPHLKSPNDTLIERAIGTGVRFAADPSFYLTGGASKAKDIPGLIPVIGDDALAPILGEMAVNTSGHVFRNGTSAATIGVMSEFGGEGGAALEKELTGEDTGVGRLVGSFGGGGVAIASQIPTKFLASKIKDIWNKRSINKKYPDMVAQQYVTGGVKEIYKLMEQDITPERFSELVKEYKKIGTSVNSGNIPLMVMAADSPYMQAELKKLMQTDATFRKQVEDEVYRLGLLIDERADQIFGTRYAPVNLENIPKQLRDQGNKLIKLRQELDQKIEQLDLSFVPENALDIGNQIQAIVAKREAIARKEMKPTYEAIDKKAAAQNIFLGGGQSTQLYKYVLDNELLDLFGTKTQIYKDILKYLKPRKNTENVTIQVVRGDKLVDTTVKRGDLPPSHKEYEPPVSPEVSWAQMDSLKRAINRYSRKDLSNSERRKLNEFKEYFKEISGEMVAVEKGGLAFDKKPALDLLAKRDAADVLYYEKIGIPYSAEGIMQINSKKYATEVYPVIFKNSESLNQFLGVAGKEGQEIAQNAYILNMYDKVMKDGVFNAKKVQILMRKDRNILDQLPQVKKMLERSIVDQSELHLKRDAINTAAKDFETEVANHFLISSALSPNYPDVARRLFKGDMAFYNKIQKDLDKVDTSTARIVNENIQREYVNQVFSNGGMKYLLDPANEKMVKTLFNEKQIKTFKNLSTLSDALKKIDIVDLNNKSVSNQVDPLAKILPGVTTQYGAAQIRDRVSSVGMKVIRILTHINQATLQRRLDKGVQDLLLHKDIEKLNQWGQTYNWKQITPEGFSTLRNIISEMIPNYIHGSAEGFALQELVGESNKRIIEERF